MSFDIERIHKSTRRVTRFLEKNPRRPSSDAIHDFRTSTRSLETAFETLGLTSRGKIKRLLDALKDVRRHAGAVRDMDVLTANVLTVRLPREQDCLVQLLEDLGAERNKRAGRLRRRVSRQAGLGKALKQSIKRIEKLFKEAETAATASKAIPRTIAEGIKLSTALGTPPRLNRKNLHAYRLKVKKLRNVLQLSANADRLHFLELLGQVKDAIGEWHDWEVLAGIASKQLDHASCKLVKHLKTEADSRFTHAITLTNRVRTQYVTPAKPRSRRKRTTLSTPVLKATSAVAED
jgi:CHAD domain-containing protein